MKLPNEIIESCLKDFHYELSLDKLQKEWYFEKGNEYNSTKRCFNLRTDDNDWIELGLDEIYLMLKSLKNERT